MNVPGAVGVNEKMYAERCVKGDLQAGVKLVQLLWSKGHDDGPLFIRKLLDLAFPIGYPPTVAGFDMLEDALAEARRKQLDPVVVALDVVEAAVAPPALPVVDVLATTLARLLILLRREVAGRGRDP